MISTAIKRGKADFAWIRGASRSMTTLNKAAAEVVSLAASRCIGMTDVTGFGLIGHAREMALGSKRQLAHPRLASAAAAGRAGMCSRRISFPED